MNITSVHTQHQKIIKKIWPNSETLNSVEYINQYLTEFFSKSSLTQHEVLDIGCGHNSDNLTEFREKIRLTGVDLDVEAIKKHPWLAEYHIAACENLPLSDNAYDLVFCRFAFEHFHDKEKAIAEIARVLKPGGICIILTVNRYAIEFMLAKILPHKLRAKLKNLLMKYPEIDTYETNYSSNDETSIINLLQKNDLKVQLPIHLFSTTSGFLRRITLLCYVGTIYSRILHKLQLRKLMSQITVVAYKN